MTENDRVFYKITCVFGAVKTPTQCVVGDYSPLKESPGRSPTTRRKFYRTTGQTNYFFMEITSLCDIYLCILLDQLTIMKILNGNILQNM